MRRRDIFLIVLVFVGPYFLRRWEGGLTGDSLEYAAIAKTMVDTGDWVYPHAGDEPYLKKPPLLFWLSAAGMSLGIGDDFGACLLPALTMLGLALAVYALLDLAGYRREGFWAAALILATRGFVRNSQRMEPLLCLFTVVAALAPLLARRRPWALSLVGIATGLAVMTKSVAGLWPLCMGAAATAIFGPARALVGLPFLLGLAGGAAIALPWHLAMAARYGAGFWEQYLGAEILRRLSADGDFHYHSPFFYLGSFATNFLPGLPLLMGAALQAARRKIAIARPLLLFLAVFTLLGVVAPLLPSTKYARYLLPLYVPLSAFAAFFVTSVFGEAAEAKLKRALGAAAIGVCILLACVPIPFRHEEDTEVRAMAPLLRYYRDRGFTTYLYKHRFAGEKAALIVYAGIYPRPIPEGADLGALEKAMVFSRDPLPGRRPVFETRYHGIYLIEKP